MEMCGVPDNISHLLFKSVGSWQTILMSGNEELARVNIRRGIFQGDTLISFIVYNSLSHTLRKVNAGYQFGKGQHKRIIHVLFIDDLKLYGNSEKEAERLTNTVRMFSKDIAMEFVSVGGIEVSSGEVIPKQRSQTKVTNT